MPKGRSLVHRGDPGWRMDLQKLLHHPLPSQRRSQLQFSHQTNRLLRQKKHHRHQPLKPPNPTSPSNASTQPSNPYSPSSPHPSPSQASLLRPMNPHSPKRRPPQATRAPQIPKIARLSNQITPNYSPAPLSAPYAKNPAATISAPQKVSTSFLRQEAQCPTLAS